MKRKSLLLTAVFALLGFANVSADETDYKEVVLSSSNVTCGEGVSFDANTNSISYTNSWTRCEIALENSNYKYLVVVARCPYVENKSTQFQYLLSDGTNEIGGAWGFAHGFYQQRRISVMNLNDKKVYMYNTTYDANSKPEGSTNPEITVDYSESSIDMTNLKKLSIASEAANASIEISAIYFTNTAPKYDNRWNFPVTAYDGVREITSAGTWGTVCLPYNAAISGAEVYKIDYKETVNGSTKIYLSQVNGVLQAGVPYIFQSIADKVGEFQEGYVTFYKAGSSTIDAASSSNGLAGTFTDATSVESGKYILGSNGKWYKSDGSKYKVNANRAYLDLSSVSTNTAGTDNAKIIVMDLGEESGTTGIVNVKTDNNADEAIYDLNGVRVANPTKGLYIKGGKKIIIK